METVTATVTPKVNDVLVCSWGYDQTNVDYYKVLKVLPKSVVIQRIKGSVTETGFMSGKSVVKVPHEVASYDNEPMTKRFRLTEDGYCVAIKSYSTAYLDKGEEHYVSWYA